MVGAAYAPVKPGPAGLAWSSVTCNTAGGHTTYYDAILPTQTVTAEFSINPFDKPKSKVQAQSSQDQPIIKPKMGG